ncbi:hypothetical protein JCM8097_004432 [Rhodosporidiobolus ruineniae]
MQRESVEVPLLHEDLEAGAASPPRRHHQDGPLRFTTALKTTLRRNKLVATLIVFALVVVSLPALSPGAETPEALWFRTNTLLTAEERLMAFQLEYDPKQEGFGVGNVNLEAYRAEMLAALDDLLGESSAKGSQEVDVLDGNKPADNKALKEATSCFLDLTCSGHAAVPNELFATDRVVSPVPSPLSSWFDLNPSMRNIAMNDTDISTWLSSRFANSAVPALYDSLPLPILHYDLIRLLVLLTRGGYYTDTDTLALRRVDTWARGAADLSDPVLAPNAATRPPSLVVGIEWTGHTETNKLNPLFTRSTGMVQWAFGAAPGHPVIVDAARRVVRNSRRVAAMRAGGDDAKFAKDGRGPLHFDPEADRMVLEWSGPAVFTDAVARYLRTRYGLSLTSLSHFSHPIRIGDVLLLPIASLNARTSVPLKVLDWALGRGWAPWRTENDLVVHLHKATWWKQKVSRQ